MELKDADILFARNVLAGLKPVEKKGNETNRD